MALCTVDFVGKSIHIDTAMNVLLPEGADHKGPFPVLYLLHGLTHDYSSWMRNTNLGRHVAALPLIVVMPDGHRSFYCNDPRPDGLAYEDHIINDVVGFVDRTFPTIRDRSARAIAGMSMGGFGAMMLALRHPDLFSVVCPQSAAIFFTHEIRESPTGVQAFAQTLPKGEYDCFTLAERFAPSAKGPHRLAIRMECGKDDGLLNANQAFHEHLARLDIPHEFISSPGVHSTDYFDARTPAILEFVMRNLMLNAQINQGALR